MERYLLLCEIYVKKMKLFVWDFHGVMEKGNKGSVLEISNTVLKQNNYSERFTMDDIHHLYGQKWWKYFEHLLPYESHERHVELRERCVDLQGSHPEIVATYIQPNDYLHEVLEAIAHKHHQILITNTTSRALGLFLNSINVSAYFHSGNTFPVDQESKKDVLIEFLEDKNYDRVVVIDDSPENKDLASIANCVFYLYAHPSIAFKPCNIPDDYKIHDLRKVLREL